MALGITPTHSAAVSGQSALPLFLTRENKLLSFFLAAILFLFLYMTSNHFPIFEPQLLPMTWLDTFIPFWPDTFLIYNSEILLFTAVYMTTRDLSNVNKYLYAFGALQVVSVAIFWIWPTTYPRDIYPSPEDVNALTHYAMNSVRAIDNPSNCAPSLHVSGCYLSSFIYLKEQRGKFPFFFGWATLVALSTLTTKQHYVIDVVTGFMLAVIIYWVFYSVIQYRPMGTTSKSQAVQPNLE